MTIDKAALAILDIQKDFGILGCYKSWNGTVSVQISNREKTFDNIPGESTVIEHDEDFNKESKTYNGIMFFRLIDKPQVELTTYHQETANMEVQHVD